MDVYNLINSKAIAEHCRKIQHQFNIEEIAILIYRNKSMNIEEKIQAYNELIRDYEDMPMIKHFHCGPYDSVKNVIKIEIERLKDVYSKLKSSNENSYYMYGAYYISSGRYDEIFKAYNKFDDVMKEIVREITEDNDIGEFNIVKKSFTDDYKITAEYYVKNKKETLVNVYDSKNSNPDIGTIFLNLPTPFKKGDLLCSNENAPFYKGYIHKSNNVFCLNWLITWDRNLNERLVNGYCDYSDMMGNGYYIYEDDLIIEECFEYDSWEYFEGKLIGMQRLLKGVKNLLQGEINLDLFVQTYNVMRKESLYNHLNYYTYEGRELAGFNKEDIEKMKKELDESIEMFDFRKLYEME